MADEGGRREQPPHPTGMDLLRQQGGWLGLYRLRPQTRAERIRRGVQKSRESRIPTWVMALTLAAVLAAWAVWIWVS